MQDKDLALPSTPRPFCNTVRTRVSEAAAGFSKPVTPPHTPGFIFNSILIQESGSHEEVERFLPPSLPPLEVLLSCSMLEGP